MKAPLMTDTNDNAPHADDTALRAVAISNVTGPEGPSYDIAPEDRHYVESIYAIDSKSITGPYEIPDNWKVSALRVTALTPDRQHEVRAKLEALPAHLTEEQRTIKETEYVGEVIRSMQSELRARNGLHSSALPYHKEHAAIAGEYMELAREHQRLGSELLRVDRHDTVRNPETGKVEAVPVFAVTGERAQAYEATQQSIRSRMFLLLDDDGKPGVESQRRLKQALHASVGIVKQLNEAKADNAEAQRRAAEMIREDRITARAKSLANIQRNTF